MKPTNENVGYLLFGLCSKLDSFSVYFTRGKQKIWIHKQKGSTKNPLEVYTSDNFTQMVDKERNGYFLANLIGQGLSNFMY